MNVYLDNVLKGFISSRAHVKLTSYTRDRASFVVTDINGDDMPEIVFALKEQGESYVGILKKDKNIWRLDHIREQKETLEKITNDILEEIAQEEVCTEALGKSFRIEELFHQTELKFIALIDGHAYYCKIEEAFREEDNNELDKEVLDFQQGDVTGDGAIDNVYLVGDRTFGEVSSYAENIEIIIKEGLTNKTISVPLPEGAGYNPTIFLADFTGDNVKDVLITLFTGGSGGYIYAYIYSFVGGEAKLIFDYESFNNQYTGDVIYEDNYKVKVETEVPPKRYILDISDKEEEYLAGLYNEQGELDMPTEGTLSGLVALNPLDYDKNRVYELSTIQRIIGIDNADTIGLVETFLKWQEARGDFEPTVQYASVYGKPKE